MLADAYYPSGAYNPLKVQQNQRVVRSGKNIEYYPKSHGDNHENIGQCLTITIAKHNKARAVYLTH